MSLIVEPDRLLEIARMVPFIEGVSEGEKAPCCEAIRYGIRCDNVATWSMRSKCCGDQGLACQGCFDLLTNGASTCGLFCRKCDNEAYTVEGMFLCTRL